jgi:hypothetical protein
MPIYTLYLVNNPSSDLIGNPITPVSFRPSSTVRNSATWNIRWDRLFRNQNYEYRKCRVRVKTTSQSINNTGTYNNSLGYLALNLPTKYHSTFSVEIATISLCHYEDSQIGSSVYNVNQNTLATKQGTNIEVPKGDSFFTISVGTQQNFAAYSSYQFTTSLNYILTFELYDKIEETE